MYEYTYTPMATLFGKTKANYDIKLQKTRFTLKWGNKTNHQLDMISYHRSVLLRGNHEKLSYLGVNILRWKVL